MGSHQIHNFKMHSSFSISEMQAIKAISSNPPTFISYWSLSFLTIFGNNVDLSLDYITLPKEKVAEIWVLESMNTFLAFLSASHKPIWNEPSSNLRIWSYTLGVIPMKTIFGKVSTSQKRELLYYFYASPTFNQIIKFGTIQSEANQTVMISTASYVLIIEICSKSGLFLNRNGKTFN